MCLPKRLQDIIAIRLLEVVLKTSWRRRLANTSWRCFGRRLEDVLRRRLLDVFRIRIAITSWRRFQDVFKTSWKTKNCYAEDALKTSCNTRNVWLGYNVICFSSDSQVTFGKKYLWQKSSLKMNNKGTTRYVKSVQIC